MAGHESRQSTYPIVYYNSPGPLATIAASNLALICWHRQLLTTYNLKDDYFHTTWFLVPEFSGGDIFPVYNTTLNLLDHQIQRLGIELHTLFYYYDNCIPAGDKYDVAKCLENSVIDANGVLSCQSTAKKLLSSGQLNPMERYRLACVFCFEEEIERVWPSVADQVEIEEEDRTIYMGRTAKMSNDSQTLHRVTLNYWTYRMRNQLNEVPGNKRASPEFRVVSSKKVYVWSEMEYFWSKLKPNEQLSLIRRIISDWNLNYDFVKCMLPKLTWKQLQHALEGDSVPRGILYSLAFDELDYRLVLQLWNYMKHSINRIQFLEVLKSLFKMGFADNLENRLFTGHVPVLLFEIWSTAPVHLRNEILQNDVEVFFCSFLNHEKVENYDFRWYGRDLRFHYDLLANVGIQKRRKIWMENWREFVLFAEGPELEKFLKLCFDTESDIFQFKEQKMMNHTLLSSYFDKFIELGVIDKLVHYLEFCSSDVDRVRTVRQKIIESNLLKMHNFKSNILVKFNDFIVGSFPSLDLANQFKKKLIRERLESWYELLDKCYFKGVINILEFFLSSKPKLLTQAKRKCYERCQKNLRNANYIDFKMKQWQEFLEWCAPSKNDIAEFKKTLPIDDLFSVLLTKAIKGQFMESYESKVWYNSFMEKLGKYFPIHDVKLSLNTLEEFLNWYFESDEAADAYKLNKIYNYKQVSVIEELFEEGDCAIIDAVLNFLFHDDQEEREKFTELILNKD